MAEEQRRWGGKSESEYEQDIVDSIALILGTPKGTRVTRPDFGCDIHRLVFGLLDASNIRRIESSARRAVSIWEPRILIKNVRASQKGDELQIGIDYQTCSTLNYHSFICTLVLP